MTENKLSIRSQVLIGYFPVFGLLLFMPFFSQELAESSISLLVKDLGSGRVGAMLVMLSSVTVALVMQYVPVYSFYRVRKTKIGTLSVLSPTIFYLLIFGPSHINNYEFFFMSVILNSTVFVFLVLHYTKLWNKTIEQINSDEVT